MGGIPLDRLLRYARFLGSAVSLTLLAILVAAISHQAPAEAVGSALPAGSAPAAAVPSTPAAVRQSAPRPLAPRPASISVR